LTFGTNGFLLAFQDSSALGDDTSGNGNDFTSSGLAAADQMSDSPTNNFCVLNPLTNYGSANPATISEANTAANYTGDYNWGINLIGTVAIELGGEDYVFEATYAASGTHPLGGFLGYSDLVGVSGFNTNRDWFSFMNGINLVANGVMGGQNSAYSYDSQEKDSTGETFASGDVMAAKVLSTGVVEFYKNGDALISSADATGITALTSDRPWVMTIGQNSGGAQNVTWTLEFELSKMDYTYGDAVELSMANVSDPTIADPSAYFQSTIYTGDGATTLAVNQGGNSTFTPDFVWVKNRDQADAHLLFDLPRGVTNYLISNTGGGQATGADTVESFDSDGFTVGDDVRVNTSGEKYVGWQWLESDTAGFDVFTFTGTGSAHTISHSLGVVPELIIIKNQNITSDWWVYHAANTSAPATDYLVLNGTDTTTDSATAWNDTAPTSSVFTVGTASNVNGDGNSHIAYIFAPVESFSKFGSYTGNGNADGPFVWCGFRPAFIVEKNTNSADDWVMWDNQRNPYNVSGTVLKPNTSGAETTATSKYIDFLSNGFKLRASDTGVNGNGNTHIFWACAETPFKTALAR